MVDPDVLPRVLATAVLPPAVQAILRDRVQLLPWGAKEPLPRDHPLLALDNVTLTPHLGSATIQTRQRMAELSVENLLAGLEGRPLTCRIA